MKIQNVGKELYRGGDDERGGLVDIYPGEIADVSDQMGERLLVTFPDQFQEAKEGDGGEAKSPAASKKERSGREAGAEEG